MKWRCGSRILDLSTTAQVMGIVNVTPDSFSDGGQFTTTEEAIAHAELLIREGAALLDIGGESTRPGADEVCVEVELARVIPVLEHLAVHHPDIFLSIDTSKAPVALAAVRAGAEIINDVRGFRDPAMVAAAAQSNAGLVVMHMRGTPRTMQKSPVYDDLHKEITDFFQDRFDALLAAGASPECIVFDPGIGFGKTLDHNVEILRNLSQYTVADRPIFIGVSRKSFLLHYTLGQTAADRDWATVAVTAYTRELGARIHRVHEVKHNLQALRMTEAILAAP